LDGTITSSFGTRNNPVLGVREFHEGLDIACGVGTKVLAVADGRVTAVGVSKTYGNYMKYDVSGTGYTIFYAHLSKVLAKEGSRVKQGQAVALSGNSGLSTGAHLHYGIYKNGSLTDPMAFVNLPYTNEVKAEYLARGETIR